MRSTCFYLLFFLHAGIVYGQPSSGQDTRSNLPRDSNYVNALMKAAQLYYFTNPDSCLILSTQAFNLAREINFKKGQVSALNTMSESNRFLGDYPEAIKLNLEALELNKEMKDSLGVARSLGFIGYDYVEFREYRQALNYLFESSKLSQKLHNQLKEVFDISNISNAYVFLEIPDSALYYGRLALNRYNGLTHGPLKTLILTRMGIAFAAMKNGDSALYYYHAALASMKKTSDRVNSPKIHRKIAEYYESTGNYDSSLFYAREAINVGSLTSQRLELLEASKLLTRLFRMQHSPDSALYYQDIERAMTDSLYGFAKVKKLQLLMLGEQQKQQAILDQQKQYKTRTKMIALLSAVGVLLLLGILLFRNNRQKQKAKSHIEKAYKELKGTQAQLIQSEKMASLGELTAGIAHEIQNPLNFVNNFSELNNELITEMREELKSGKIDSAINISKDIESNESKILEHGKRADSIVKSMLQHTRTGSGKKEEVNINALTKEHVRLAYHGWRAKDKSFNTKLETHFDESIPKIQVVPQDIGRVILNLVNNAFYAVSENQKANVKEYVPSVWVETKNSDNNIEVIIKDNGKGIPKEVVDKIFQPFFTTKPAGQGTGLGLSLSYDIVKAHGGQIKVHTKEGEGTTITIELPK